MLGFLFPVLVRRLAEKSSVCEMTYLSCVELDVNLHLNQSAITARRREREWTVPPAVGVGVIEAADACQLRRCKYAEVSASLGHRVDELLVLVETDRERGHEGEREGGRQGEREREREAVSKRATSYWSVWSNRSD